MAATFTVIGFVKDVDEASVRVGIDGEFVTIGGAGFPVQARLNRDQRELFARLFRKAARRADAYEPSDG